MAKVSAYIIVSAASRQELSDAVNKKIWEGWQPLSGPFAVHGHLGEMRWIAQAIVQYESERPASGDGEAPAQPSETGGEV